MNKYIYFKEHGVNWDSVVGTVTRLWVGWPRNCASQFLAGKGDLSLLRYVQTRFEVHPASYSVGIKRSCSRSKEAQI
jgi:hypothetical protein